MPFRSQVPLMLRPRRDKHMFVGGCLSSGYIDEEALCLLRQEAGVDNQTAHEDRERSSSLPPSQFKRSRSYEAIFESMVSKNQCGPKCRGHLLPGPSATGRNFVRKLEYADEEAWEEFDKNEALEPTRLERRWVRVAWPSHTPGALCVLACEKLIMGRAGGENLMPKHYGLVSLARTMDERCTVLQRLGGTMYSSIDEYQGPIFLKAWEENHQGEKGPLVKLDFIDPSSYGGHPDEALGIFQ